MKSSTHCSVVVANSFNEARRDSSDAFFQNLFLAQQEHNNTSMKIKSKFIDRALENWARLFMQKRKLFYAYKRMENSQNDNFGSIFDRKFLLCCSPASGGKFDRWAQGLASLMWHEKLLRVCSSSYPRAIIADSGKQTSWPWHQKYFKPFNPNRSYRFSRRDKTWPNPVPVGGTNASSLS